MEIRTRLESAQNWCKKAARWRKYMGASEIRRASLLYTAGQFSAMLHSMTAYEHFLEKLCRYPSFYDNPHIHWAYRRLGEQLCRRVNEKEVAQESVIANLPVHSRAALAFVRNRASLQSDIAGKQVVTDSHPTWITFLMIDKCQAACHMCGGDYRASMTKHWISLDAYKQMLSHLRMELVDHITYGGGGEPLLNRDLVCIAEYTTQNFGHVKTQIITNAIGLKPEVSTRLLRAGLDFCVSMNSATAETYRRVFSIDKFDIVSRNVRELIRLRDTLGSRSKVTLSICLSHLNIAELPRLVELAHQWGADDVLSFYVRFYPENFRHKKHTSGGNELHNRDSLYFHQAESDRYVAEALSLARQFGVGFASEPTFSEPFETADFSTRPCHYAWEMLYVGYDGEIYFCPGGEVLFQQQVEGGLYESGNLLTNDIEEIRNNAFHQCLRRTVTGVSAQTPECQVCGNCIMRHGPRSQKAHLLEWKQLKGPSDQSLVIPIETLINSPSQASLSE